MTESKSNKGVITYNYLGYLASNNNWEQSNLQPGWVSSIQNDANVLEGDGCNYSNSNYDY